MKKISNKKLQLSSLKENLSIFFHNLSADHFKRTNKFVYDPQSILTEFATHMQPLILYTIMVKFPLIISLPHSQVLKQYDQQIKKLYQGFLSERKLIHEFQFQFLILIIVKCSKRFMEKEFEYLQYGKQDQRQTYCTVIKILLGLSVHQKAYTIVQKKYIDQQRIDNYPVIHQHAKKETRQSQSKNDRKSSKRLISINWIQAKMERRKQNRFKKYERSSINTWRNSHEIDQFKQNLQKELRVINQTDQKIKRIKYEALQKKNLHPIQQQKQIRQLMKNQCFKRTIIHTQQISSSLQLSLMMKECSHSYTRRNIPIRLTDSTPRLSHQVYQLSPNKRHTSPRESTTIPAKPKEGGGLSKKTKTYWHKMANKMREINSSFEY